MSKVGEWLQSLSWGALAGHALSIAIAGAVAYYVAQMEVGAQIELQREQFQRSQLSELRAAAQDFNVSGGTYVSSILDNGDVVAARQQLMQSIQRQHAAVDLSEPDFSPEVRKLADDYQTQLVELATIVQAVSEIREMRVFWEKMSDVLVARDAFLVSLAADKSGK